METRFTNPVYIGLVLDSEAYLIRNKPILLLLPHRTSPDKKLDLHSQSARDPQKTHITLPTSRQIRNSVHVLTS